MTVDLTAYPKARNNRLAGGTQYEQATQYARSRVFPFVLRVGVINRRRTMSFARCIGPALIRRLGIFVNTTADAPTAGVQVGWSRTACDEADVVLTTPVPYNNLWELENPTGTLAAAAGASFPFTNAYQMLSGGIDLELVVTEPDFYPVVSIWNYGSIISTIYGYLRVHEAIEPAVLRNFL